MALLKAWRPNFPSAWLVDGSRKYNGYFGKRSYSQISPVQMSYTVFESQQTNKDAPPLIIMHGLFGSKMNWRGIGKALDSKLKRRIFAVDARNHGDSPHTSSHAYPEMAADVVQFMKDRNIDKAVLMGHSMGGRSMMYFALKYPHLIDRGIIVDISPVDLPRDFSYMEDILKAMKNINVSSELSLAEGRKVVENQIKDAVDSSGTVDFIMMNLRKRESGEFYWAINVDSLLKNIGAFGNFMSDIKSLPPYQGPMMFLCGNQSNYVNPSSWPSIQGIFPNSEIHWLDAGHLVHFDQPAQFIDLVVKFVNKVG